MAQPLILLTGASGYIGGHLLDALLAKNYRVRCLSRRAPSGRDRETNQCEWVQGDVLDKESLPPAMENVDTAFYMVHSMYSAGNFEELDRQAARNFGTSAHEAGIRRIIYLGGLADPDEGLSAHMQSRHEVGEILRESGCQVIELRASIVIGSGSLSFEIIRALVERLPMMITPRWVRAGAQPIAIDDLLEYLVQSIEIEVDGNPIFEIGGKDRVSYLELLREYAACRRLRTLVIPVPVLTPWLSSLWLGLVTPFYAQAGRRLIESVRNSSVIRDPTALDVFAVRPKGARGAIAQALRDEDRYFAENTFSATLSSAIRQDTPIGTRIGNRIMDSCTVDVSIPAHKAFAPIRRIGGQTGWYYGNWLWWLRGAMDRLVGGVGMGRGRRDTENLTVGDTVDCWRVVEFEPDRRLRFEADMKMPGRAWLEFEVQDAPQGSTITQTAVFDPRGTLGLIYWVLLYPVHRLIFDGMLRRIAESVE